MRYYVRQHLLRPLEFRGTATRYQRRELLLLLGLRQLETEGKSTLADKKRRLDPLDEPELERLLCSRPISTEAAAALGLECSHASTDLSWQCDPFAAGGGQGLELGCNAMETWRRIALLPGLELMLRADAQAMARAAAQRILSDYSRGSSD